MHVQEGREEELGGALFGLNGQLEFRRKEGKTEQLKTALAAYEIGDASSAELLHLTAADAYQTHSRYTSPLNPNLTALHYTVKVMDAARKGDIHILDANLRKEIANIYRTLIINRSNAFSLKELGANEPGFLGVFHTHPEGTEPSPSDVDSNRENGMPNLVVSPQVDKSIILYLVTRGEYKQLHPTPAATKGKISSPTIEPISSFEPDSFPLDTYELYPQKNVDLLLPPIVYPNIDDFEPFYAVPRDYKIQLEDKVITIPPKKIFYGDDK